MIDLVKAKYSVVARGRTSSWYKKVEKFLRSEKGFDAWKRYTSTHGYDIRSQSDIEDSDDDKTEIRKLKKLYADDSEELLMWLSAAEINGSKMKIYRCLDLDDVKEDFLNKLEDDNGLGVYWTFSKDDVGCWGANMNAANWWVLVGWVDVKDIELIPTLMKNMMPDLSHEREIQVKYGADVFLDEIYRHKKPREKHTFKNLKLSA